MLKQRRGLTQDAFDQLLGWLDPDRDLAAIKYEAIRVSLIRILTWRGCNNAEDLADETFNRVAEKVHLLKNTFVGDPAFYFHAVAKRLIKEERRKLRTQISLSENLRIAEFPSDPVEATDDTLYECLASCLRNAGQKKEKMILSYYVGERQVRIANRKAMADELGIPLNALRVRMHRIRGSLENCIQNCVKLRMQNESKPVTGKRRRAEPSSNE